MAGGSSPSTSSAPTIYQLSSLPPPSSLAETPTIDSDLLKPPGKTFLVCPSRPWVRVTGVKHRDGEVCDQTLPLFSICCPGPFTDRRLRC